MRAHASEGEGRGETDGVWTSGPQQEGAGQASRYARNGEACLLQGRRGMPGGLWLGLCLSVSSGLFLQAAAVERPAPASAGPRLLRVPGLLQDTQIELIKTLQTLTEGKVRRSGLETLGSS